MLILSEGAQYWAKIGDMPSRAKKFQGLNLMFLILNYLYTVIRAVNNEAWLVGVEETKILAFSGNRTEMDTIANIGLTALSDFIL